MASYLVCFCFCFCLFLFLCFFFFFCFCVSFSFWWHGLGGEVVTEVFTVSHSLLWVYSHWYYCKRSFLETSPWSSGAAWHIAEEAYIFLCCISLRLLGRDLRILLQFGASFCLFVCLFVWDRVSQYTPGCPETHSVRPGWPQTQKSTCLCLPSAGIKGVLHHCPASSSF